MRLAKFLLTAAICLTLGSSGLFAANGGAACATHYYAVEPVKLMPALLKHYKELKLSEEQRERIKLLIKKIKPRAVALDIRIDRLSKEIRRDMVSSNNGFLIKSELQALAALKVERSLLNYECVRSLKKILTEEQFKKLLDLAGVR